MEELIWKRCTESRHYFISNAGDIYSLITGKMLNLNSDTRGYIRPKISVDGKGRSIYAHRMVMSAFKGPSNLDVNHINGIKTDNRLENLEYCTHTENIRHAYMIGLVPPPPNGEKSTNSKLTRSQIFEILEGLKDGEKQRDIAKKYGVSQRCINFINKRQTYKNECNAWDQKYR